MPSRPHRPPPRLAAPSALVALTLAAAASLAPGPAAAQAPADPNMSSVPGADAFDIRYYVTDEDGNRGRAMAATDFLQFVNQARCECGHQIATQVRLKSTSGMTYDNTKLIQTFVGTNCGTAEANPVGQFRRCAMIKSSTAPDYVQGLNTTFHPVWLTNGVAIESGDIRDPRQAIAAGSCVGGQGESGVWMCAQTNAQSGCQSDEFFISGTQNANLTAGMSGGIKFDFLPPVTEPENIRASAGDSAVVVSWDVQPGDINGFRVLCEEVETGNPPPNKGMAAPALDQIPNGTIYYTKGNLCPNGPFSTFKAGSNTPIDDSGTTTDDSVGTTDATATDATAAATDAAAALDPATIVMADSTTAGGKAIHSSASGVTPPALGDGVRTASLATIGDATGEDEGASDAPVTADQMFAKATELAGDDDVLIGLIEDAQAEGSRGRIGGAVEWLSRLPAGQTDVWEIPFYGNSYAEIAVAGDGDADLDVAVTDENGNVICYDVSYSDRIYCDFTPAWDGYFYVTVQNMGGSRNINLSAGSVLGGNVYAPDSSLVTSGALDVYGSVFVRSFNPSAAVKIHHDIAILNASQSCGTPGTGGTIPTCQRCQDCGGQACKAGQCGSCVTAEDCCSPLSCKGGKCVDATAECDAKGDCRGSADRGRDQSEIDRRARVHADPGASHVPRGSHARATSWSWPRDRRRRVSGRRARAHRRGRISGRPVAWHVARLPGPA